MDKSIKLATRIFTPFRLSVLMVWLSACTVIAPEDPLNEVAALAAINFRSSCDISTIGYVKISENREYSIWRGPQVLPKVNEYFISGDPFECPIFFRSTNGTFEVPASNQIPSAGSSSRYFEVAPYAVMGDKISPPNELNVDQMFPGSDLEAILTSPQFANCLYPVENESPELSALQRVLYGINTTAELYVVPPGQANIDGLRFIIGCGRVYFNGGLVV